MKLLKKMIALVLVALVLFNVTACSKSIVGTWKNEQLGTTYTFNSDKTGQMSVMGYSVDITWKTSGSTLTITYTILGISQDTIMQYKIEGNTLSFVEGGTSLSFSKQ